MKVKIKWISLGLLMTYSSSFLLSLLQTFIWPNQQMDNQAIYTSQWSIINAILISPIIEETLFRNLLIPFLQNKGWKNKEAIFLSAFLFTIIHLNPWFLPYFINGCIYSIIKLKTNDCYSSTICHSLYNFCALLPIML